MNKTQIDWPGLDYTWNPVTGCRRACPYCYARKIHERFYKTPFSEIVSHPNRLNEPRKLKKPSKIFVGSMSDIQYWDPLEIADILGVVEDCPQHTFMFLTKNPSSYSGVHWPRNTMQGFTETLSGYIPVDTPAHPHTDKFAIMSLLPRPFLSIEPLLGKLHYNPGDHFELIIVGAMTGPGAVKPKPEWIQSVKENVPADKIYWKKNIRNLR